MANISTNLIIQPTTATNSTAELTRLQATVPGLSGSQNLPQHVLGSNTSDLSGDDVFGPSNNQGTNVQVGTTLQIDDGASVSAGSIKCRINSGSEAGGILRIDNGSSLTCAAWVAEGQVGGGGTELVPADADSDQFANLLVLNGSNLNFVGNSGDNYRAIIGNWGKGRIVCTGRSSIIIDPQGSATPFGANGSSPARSNLFLGFRSRFNNCLLRGANKVELLGAIPEFENVTLEFVDDSNSNGRQWLTDPQPGGSGAFYLAGAANIEASLGAHTIVLPASRDIWPSSGNDSFKYSVIREQASILTVNGAVNIQYGDSEFNPYSHLFQFQSQGRDLARRFRLQGTLSSSGTRLDASGAAAGTFGGKFALMDNRDFLQITHDTDAWTAGVAPNATYDWYNLPNHALSNTDFRHVAVYGFPTGGSSKVYGFSYEDTSANKSSIRSFARAFWEGAPTDALSLQNLNEASGTNAVTRADLRRFYPFRGGAIEWGYRPEFINGGLGGTAQLGFIGDGITDTEVHVGNARIADASADDVRNGKSVSFSVGEDPVLTGVNYADADLNATFTVSSVLGQSDVMLDSEGGLDRIHQRVSRWAYDTFSSDEGQTYTATALTATNQHASGQGIFAGNLIGSGNYGLYSTVPTTATDNTVSSGSAWSQVVAMRMGSSVDLLNEANGRVHQWLTGFIYMYRSASSWALYSFERTYDEQVASLDLARLTHIASAGTVGGGTTRFQISELRDSLALQTDWTARDYLWRNDVALRPTESSGTTMNMRRMILDYRDSEATPGTALTSVHMADTMCELQNVSQLSYSVTSEVASNSINYNPINGFQNEDGGDAISAGVTVGAGINLAFLRGQRFLVAGDITNASLLATGSGSDNVTLIYTGDGTGPTSATNFDILKRVSVSFVGSHNWTDNDLDTEWYTNIAAVSRASSASTGGTTRTPVSRSISGSTVTYNFEIPVSEDLYYAFAARQVSSNWYTPVEGNSVTTLSPSHTLSTVQSNVVPFAFTSASGLSTQEQYIQDSDVFQEMTAVATVTNRMRIQISETAAAGALEDGKYIHRLVQQKTNYLLNVARAYYQLNGWVVGTDRIIYNNIFVEWTKEAANTNIVAFSIQTLSAAGSGVNTSITTTSTETFIQWNGPTNIGFLSEAQFEAVAKESSVWAANAAL